MEAVTSVIAVLGTLLGVGVSHLFQARSLRRAEVFSRAERLRQERMEAYTAFAAALVALRRAQTERWLLDRGKPFDEGEPAMRARAFDLRNEAYDALFRVQLVTERPELVRRAEAVLEVVGRIKQARDEAEFDVRRVEAKQQIHAFVAEAKGHLG
ncbi:hypothetical protein G6045_26375 [Streptomyces sp. YC504]|uniref:Protein kilB n=1 Tax=Streptomyces mesophilus TaxID=1775132 RepID=A0A6G4XPK6_9ACTN|nr:hypothetical protein [Streptomyces mesophilus]NGO79153.1 hypothetical protein [Streptomyces mesophilus]